MNHGLGAHAGNRLLNGYRDALSRMRVGDAQFHLHPLVKNTEWHQVRACADLNHRSVGCIADDGAGHAEELGMHRPFQVA